MAFQDKSSYILKDKSTGLHLLSFTKGFD